MGITKSKLYLFIAGLILVLVGSYIGFLPGDYLTQLFGDKEFSFDSLSEMRGMGGSLFVIGLFVFSAAFIKRIESPALVISALIYGSFSVFRLLSLIVDGQPSSSILYALSIELLFTLIAIPLLSAIQPNSLSIPTEAQLTGNN